MNPEDASDPEVMDAIGRHQNQALVELYRRYGGLVHSLAMRVLRAHHLAEEVVQDVFLELWRRPERFDPDRGSLRAYLLALTHGRAVDLVRSESTRLAREKRVGRAAMAGYDVEDDYLDPAMAERVRMAMRTLPLGERKSIALAYFDGHTYREVAAILGKPEGTVKSWIRTGLRRLRIALIDAGVNPS